VAAVSPKNKIRRNVRIIALRYHEKPAKAFATHVDENVVDVKTAGANAH
jgi:hypothetical protein